MDLEETEARTDWAGEDPGKFNRLTDKYKGVLHVEAGSNTSTIALRVIGGDETGTQCNPVPGRYKYGDLALEVGGVSNLRQ
jgi:hypothetical protein